MLSYGFWLLFSFRGRIGRFLFIAASLVWAFAASLFLGAMRPEIERLPESLHEVSLVRGGLALGVAVIVYVQQALAAKRFHDMGMSGWWTTAPLAGVLGIGEYFDGIPADAGGLGPIAPMLVVGIAIGSALLYLWALYFGPGEPGPNDYGRCDMPPSQTFYAGGGDEPASAAPRVRRPAPPAHVSRSRAEFWPRDFGRRRGS